MRKWSVRNIVLLAAAVPVLGGCVAPYQQGGAGTGAAIGGISGAILDQRNPWRGGVIGASLGAIAGATISEISAQGAREAAYAEQPVKYQTEGGRGYYYAEPLGYDDHRCKRVREEIYEDGRLMRERVTVICGEENHNDRRHYRHEHDRDDEDDD